MIGPEDIHETPKTNYTPILILGIASLLLLIVGFISYRDYVNAKADERVKVSDDRIRKLEEKLEQLNDRNQPVGDGDVAASPVPQRDPEIEALRSQLEAMKIQAETIRKQTEENKLKAEENSMTMQRVLDGGPEPTFSTIPSPGIQDDVTLPDYVRNSVATPPEGSNYGSPGAQNDLTDAQERIKNAASIGKIVSYDEGWNLVTIDAGKSQGVEIGQRYSVRRGTNNLGIVKIFETTTSQSNANLVTDNRKFDGALKPRAGDEIIAFDPF
ncbi:MAG: hypothetical protein P1V20_18725 [Verrucomicrobiales bacterium]|nr:hypothetical protein [Verrucomicrobiales bacterium]